MSQDRDEKGMFASPADKQISRENEELLGLYLHSLKEQKKDTKQSTLDTRRREVRYWFAFCEHNDVDPLAAETRHVRGYIQSITDLAGTTVSSYYRSVQSFYSIVENDQREPRLTLENGHPCPDHNTINLKDDYRIFNKSEYKKQHRLSPEDVDVARDKSANVLALKPERVHELFDNVPGKTPETRLRNEIAVRLNWYTACRSVELESMTIEGIDWDECKISIRSAKLNVDEHGDLIRRDVFFPREFKFELKRWCERVRHSFSSAVEPGEGRILCTTHKEHMQSWHINDVVKEAARNAGIQRPLRPANPDEGEEIKEWFVTTHRIRRSAISHWVNDVESLDLHQVRRIAGHAQIERTMQYVEPDDDALAQDYQRGMEA